MKNKSILTTHVEPYNQKVLMFSEPEFIILQNSSSRKIKVTVEPYGRKYATIDFKRKE